jgi:hypothetical protein
METLLISNTYRLLSVATVFFFCEAEAAKSVSLNLKAVIDTVLSIARIDGDDDIDVLSNPKLMFRVIYNGIKSIDVKFTSRNDWNLQKADDVNKKINYVCLVNGKKIKDAHKIALLSQFHDSKYDFEATFEVANRDNVYEPGEYYDNVTLTVAEMDN